MAIESSNTLPWLEVIIEYYTLIYILQLRPFFRTVLFVAAAPLKASTIEFLTLDLLYLCFSVVKLACFSTSVNIKLFLLPLKSFLLLLSPMCFSCFYSFQNCVLPPADSQNIEECRLFHKFNK